MALKVRPRKNDPEEVQVLFAAHKLMNHGGKHWIKRHFRKRDKNGEWCYCLSEALRVATPRKLVVRAEATRLIVYVLSKRRRNFFCASLVGFNDHSSTEWPDVEEVLRNAISIGRGE